MDIQFSAYNFDYTIKFYEDSLYILCEHGAYYFEEIQNGLMQFKFTTKFMYELINKYKNNKLEKNIEITFPEKIKDATASVPIRFTINSIE